MAIRNAELTDLVAMLRQEHARKEDVVATSGAISFREDGVVTIDGVGEPTLTADGVDTFATYRPTRVAQEGLAAKLGVPIGYLRRCADEKPELWAANLNGWAADDPSRKFMARTFRAGNGEPGVLRAFLSDSYSIIDNLDVLVAVLQGVKDSGHPVAVTGADLSERHMFVRVKSEMVATAARALLEGYRSPFSGLSAEQLPLVNAGFIISNSEVGAGAASITPRAEFQVCSNGLTIKRDAMRAVHVGSKLDEGVVQASQRTRERQLDLITARTTDAVRKFLSEDYLNATLRDAEKRAGVPVTDAAKTVEIVAKQIDLTQGQAATVLDHFIRGGQLTAGGVMQAVTSAAQVEDDGDAAFDLEAKGLDALMAASNIHI